MARAHGSYAVMAALLLGGGPHAAAQTPEQSLSWALAAYQNGGYHEAAAQLESLLYPLKLTDPREIKDARLHLGLCHYILGRPAEARVEFARVLEEDPQTTLDPVLTPPDLLAFFDEVRRATTPSPTLTPAPPPPDDSELRALWWDVAPLGLAQVAQGRPARGAILLSAEVALTVTSAATWGYLTWMERTPPSEEQYAQMLQLRAVNQVAFWGAASVFAFGLGDALVHSGRLPHPNRRASLTPTPSGLALSVSF